MSYASRIFIRDNVIAQFSLLSVVIVLSASEMTYNLSSGALNSTHYPLHVIVLYPLA